MNIVAYIKQGDLLVFNEVFHQYHQKLYYYVLSKTKSSFCAEEVVQITFIKLWQYRSSLNEEISVDAQLFRIAKTTLIDQLRRQDASNKLTAVVQTAGQFDYNQGLSNLDRKELQKKLQSALAQMPPVRRKVFELSRLQGLSYKEIAVHLSISEKTVENHINYALKQLRQNYPLALLLCVLLKNNF